MNWRRVKNNMDMEYNHPNNTSFPDLVGFLSYLKSDKKLRTFFNDHPMPAATTLSKKEVNFRWDGLTSWMEKGISFWWFDRNWKMSVVPPFTNGSDPQSNWEGLTTADWGSHLYFQIVSSYNA